jgi:hypothetical protein
MLAERSFKRVTLNEWEYSRLEAQRPAENVVRAARTMTITNTSPRGASFLLQVQAPPETSRPPIGVRKIAPIISCNTNNANPETVKLSAAGLGHKTVHDGAWTTETPGCRSDPGACSMHGELLWTADGKDKQR